MLQLRLGNGEGKSDNLFCFFSISAEKREMGREKDVIGSEGQMREGESESRYMEILDGAN